MRLPLQPTTKSRDGTIEKDTLVTNGMVENYKSGKSYTVKRPGITTLSQGSGVAKGAIFYGETLYHWDENTTDLNPLETNFTLINGQYYLGSLWVAQTSYNIDTPVVYDNGDGNGPQTYYSAYDGNDTIPGTATEFGAGPDVLWSKTPFGSVRYRAGRNSNPPRTAASAMAAGYLAYLDFPTTKYTSCQNSSPSGKFWLQFAEAGTAFGIRYNQWNDANSTPIGACNAGANSLGQATAFGSYVSKISD